MGNRIKQQAIPGFNIETLKGTTVDECQTACSKQEECKAVEFATTRAAGGTDPAVYSQGTCLLQSTDSGGVSPGDRYKNLDLYTKYGCTTPMSDVKEDMDCSAEYNDWPMQWVKSWSDAKKAYCCKTANRGCPDQLP